MLPEENRHRQELLNQIILELSESVLDEDKNEQYLNRIGVLYTDNFKHQYSDFFPTILKILEEDNNYNIDYLSNNLDILGNCLDKQIMSGNAEYQNRYIQFTKLFDHLDLQIRQTNYYKSMLAKSNDASQDLQEAIDNLNDAKNKIADATTRADTMQTQLISILSIFAAIIITFSGSFTFLGSSVNTISGAKYPESVIAAAIICGLFLFNTVFLMMYFVSKLTGRNIYTECITHDCSKCEKDCNNLVKIRKRIPYAFWINVAAIIGIAVDLIIWYLDIKDIFI
ncbi:MAG: hypothetical protein NC433_03055 [Clostridiales bacterium]|nr:hypothetical protein [Clostridiales bacterium]